MRYVSCCFLLLVLCVSVCCSAVAEAVLIPEMNTWDWTSMPMEVSLQADVQCHMPYDETRVQQLNALLGHLTLQLHFQQHSDERWSNMSLFVDEEAVLSMRQREAVDRTEAQFSVSPYATYWWEQDSGVDLGSLLGGSVDAELWLDGSETSWMNDALQLFDAMSISMPEYLTDKKYLVTVENMGKATRKQTIIVPKSAVSELPELLAGLSPDGELKELLRRMVFAGRQSLTLWRDENGAILRADWTGQAGMTQKDLREVSLVWRLCRSEEQVKDELTLKTPRVQGSGRNNLTIDRVIKQDGDQARMDMKLVKNTLENGEKTVVTAEFALDRTTIEGRSHVQGEVSIQQQEGDDDDYLKLVLLPDFVMTGTQETPAMDGLVNAAMYQNKKLLEQAKIAFSAEQSDWMLWELRPDQQQVDAANQEAVASQLVKSMAVDLVRRLVLLPGEDTLFLSADLDPEMWKQIVDAAQSALQ